MTHRDDALPDDVRKLARVAQALVEQRRLSRHQRIARRLISLPARDAEQMIGQAKAVVERWRQEKLCSIDYIERWSAMLALSPADLAKAMVSDAEGWGTALRQNSPWVAIES